MIPHAEADATYVSQGAAKAATEGHLMGGAARAKEGDLRGTPSVAHEEKARGVVLLHATGPRACVVIACLSITSLVLSGTGSAGLA